MDNTIFIPKIINVGYQLRKDTYTGKLAYVIYTDEKGVLRKQSSWDNWRDDDITPDTFDNVPTTGFVLNKKVGDTQSHWNFRQAYCRVYDPRGFEFGITIENLLYILENTNSIVGKGLEGSFVYGWSGKDLVLIPTNSPDYKDIMNYTEAMFSEDIITGKDLVIGVTYKGKDGCLYTYLGKYETWTTPYPYNTDVQSQGKQFWFATFKDIDSLNTFDINKFNTDYRTNILYRKSIPKKFLISVHDSTVSPYLSDLIEFIEHIPDKSPVDLDKTRLKFFTEDEWVDYVLNSDGRYWKIIPFCTKPHNNVPNNYKIESYGGGTDKFKLFQFVGNSEYNYNCIQENILLDENMVKKLFQEYKPCYVEVMLTNGKLWKRTYRWYTK